MAHWTDMKEAPVRGAAGPASTSSSGARDLLHVALGAAATLTVMGVRLAVRKLRRRKRVVSEKRVCSVAPLWLQLQRRVLPAECCAQPQAEPAATSLRWPANGQSPPATTTSLSLGLQVGVLPARFQSSRFPGKPLVPILGKPMILRTYEQVRQQGAGRSTPHFAVLAMPSRLSTLGMVAGVAAAP